jgi:hypothetical protein
MAAECRFLQTVAALYEWPLSAADGTDKLKPGFFARFFLFVSAASRAGRRIPFPGVPTAQCILLCHACPAETLLRAEAQDKFYFTSNEANKKIKK